MNYKIIQNNEFPSIPERINNLFLDTETTSFDPKKKSIDVWKSCWVAGIVFTWDDHDTIYFIPVRYRDSLSEEKNCTQVHEFVNKLFANSRTWINHNIKYDYHVLSRERFAVTEIELFDTLTQAKLIESDRFRYDEDSLAADWLNEQDVDVYKRAMYPWIKSSQDWGEVPIRIIAPYAAHDVDKNRRLYHYILNNMSEDCWHVSQMEMKVTRCLCRTEGVGLTVDTQELAIEELKTTAAMANILADIRRQVGYYIRPNVNADCYELFNKKYGLPVVGNTDKGEPSYDKDALATLKQYPQAPLELIETFLEYRKHVSHNGFVKSYRNIELNGRLHASYNQAIRTGRMSCSNPNMQQLDKAAKKLIHPPKGYAFLSFDYSSIEFRILAHYLGQSDILEAYVKDPDTDFHQWVADMCHVERKPAKNINFCMAYGGGKGKVLSMLANNADIISQIQANSPEEFEELCQRRANDIFTQYHRVLHRLRPLTSMAANRLKLRGYVKNAYGRHRQLPDIACYRALNTVIQSGAADCMKAAVVATSPLYNAKLKAWGVEQVAYVHDEILFVCPINHVSDILDAPIVEETLPDGKIKKWTSPIENSIVQEIVRCMIANNPFDVPLRVSASISTENWADLIEIPKEAIYAS